LTSINLSKELRKFRQNQILLVRPASLPAQLRTTCKKTSGGGDLRLIHSGAKAASCRIEIMPSRAISSEEESVEAQTVRRISGVVQNAMR
jgi:hypothetical protein